MKFLLFFVSMIFSSIFFVFNNLTEGKNIFGTQFQNKVNITCFSGNLMIESFIFLVLGIIYLYLFSSINKANQLKLGNKKLEIFYFLYYFVFLFYIYFFNNVLNNFLFIIIAIFVISDILFNHLSNISRLNNYKIKLRYGGLILNYLCILLSMYYINKNGLIFLVFYILIFNIIFNYSIHKKYINYISLSFSIIIILFLIYNLFFLLFDIYSLYF